METEFISTLRHRARPFIALLLLTVLPTNATHSADPPPGEPSRLDYPQARRGDQVDDYHGTLVADPYRWLEDVDSAETRAWVQAENQLTSACLDKIPARASIRRRLTALWNYTRYGIPIQAGGRFFFTQNEGLQNQAVLYWSPALDAQPRLLLDPNKLSADGTVALMNYAVSDDGHLLVYALAAAGSDWQEWHVRNVDSGQDLSDDLKWIKSSFAAWTPDNQGFYYSRYDEPAAATKFVDANYYQKLFYHRIGTPQTADRLVYERQDQKEWEFDGRVSEDGKYLVISVEHGTERKNLVFYQRLDQPDAKVIELISNFESKYEYLGNDGSVFWFFTDLDAPRGRIIAIDLERPERANWREMVPQGKDSLTNAIVVSQKLFLSYLQDAHSQVKVYDLQEHWQRDVELPGLGTVGFDGRRKDPDVFFSFTGLATPATIYRFDPTSGKSLVYRQPKVDFDTSDYETRQVFYASRDGTRVPMFVSFKKGLELNGQNPTLLYGYGGFNIPLTPSFSVPNLVWMEMGGVYAMPNLRGGGEYGRDWHEAGTKLKKQNVFDDFIAAAQWLIEQHYTSTPKLAIAGRSNGGLLVGACLTQRPDLFGAALPGVGVMDMLRFNKFTVGWGWTSDYGSSDNPEEFKALYAYSPLHNIKPGTHYPTTLVTTADHDDRVVPGHSFKFTAALQAAQAGPAPILIRIETAAGHGAGTPVAKLIDESTDELAFLVDALHVNITAKP